jgi:hypothetical protein
LVRVSAQSTVPAWVSADSADRTRSAIRGQASFFDTRYLPQAGQHRCHSY